MEKKKTPILILILGVVLAAAVVVGLIFGVKALNERNAQPTEPAGTGEPVNTGEPSGTGEPGTAEPTASAEPDPAFDPVRTKDRYTEDGITGDDARLDKVVAECGDYTLTNRQAQVFYFMQYYSLLEQYGSYVSMLGLDTTLPLSGQDSFAPGLTWEQLFLYSGITENVGLAESELPCFHTLAALASKANAEGVKLSEEEQASFDAFLAQMEEMAVSYGFANADEMLQADMGISADLDAYSYFQQLYSLAITYDNLIYQDSQPTEEDLQAYLVEHPEEFEELDADAYTIDVRHILISFDLDGDGTETDEEKAEARAKAEALLAEYLTNPVEDHFAALANENSTDPGSNTNGGLYEGVSEGQMVDTFNDWCFDAARQPGDTGIVETSYGYHVMYFVGAEEAWKSVARDGITSQLARDMLEDLREAYPLTVRYEDIVLSPLPLPEEE